MYVYIYVYVYIYIYIYTQYLLFFHVVTIVIKDLFIYIIKVRKEAKSVESRSFLQLMLQSSAH